LKGLGELMEVEPEMSPDPREGPVFDAPLRNHLNQYEILRTLGRGTHGKVVLGRNMKTSKLVVRSKLFLASFLRYAYFEVL
jgi:serine/threonine protein kinase